MLSGRGVAAGPPRGRRTTRGRQVIADAAISGRRQSEAERHVELGDIAIVTEEWSEQIDILKLGDRHHLQLSFLPVTTNAKGGFPDHWGPHRLERMGALFLLPAGQSVHARSDCRLQRSITCRLDPGALSRWFDRELEWTDRRLSGTLDMACAPVRRLLCRIADELRAPGFASEAMIDLMIAEIGVELSRHFLTIDERGVTGGLAPWRLRLIDDRLADDAGSATLSNLARLCNLSVRHLTRAFRQSRGRSLGDVIAERRVDHACHLLQRGISIKETAFAAGFTAPTNFTTAFRRATGESPREYRQRVSG